MEQQHSNEGQFIVLSKATWQSKTSDEGSNYRDDGKIDIQISKWYGKALISIDKLSVVDVFPGDTSVGASTSHIPDYIGAVTGNRFCLVYQTEKSKCLFVVYNIDETNKKVSVTTQFVFDIERPPTAIMAIKDKVFLGFRGQVGYVDLTQPTLSLNMFHNWSSFTYKQIDAFAYDSTLPDSELVAVDDFVSPKYAFEYKVNRPEPKCVAKFDLPSGVNENYRHAIKGGNRMVLTARSYTRGGEGNSIVVFEGTRAVLTLDEFSPWEDSSYKQLIVGTEYTQLSSLGLLDNNIILVTAGARGVIAIPIDQIRRGEIDGFGADVPYGVKNLHIGTSASELVTVKEKSTAFVLGTTDNDDKHSVLSQLKWNSTTNDLEVVCSHNIEGSYDRLFMEV